MTEQVDDEISLLDLLVVIAENWLVLVLIPLVIAAATYGFLATQSQPLRTQATISLSPAVVGSFVADAIAEGRYDETLAANEDGGLALEEGPETKSTLLQLTSEDRDAHAQFRSLVDELVAFGDSEMVDVEGDRVTELQNRLSLHDGIIAQLESALGDLADDPDFDPEAYASSVTALDTMLTRRDVDAMELAALQEEAAMTAAGEGILIAPVTGPERVGRSPLLLAVLALLGSGFVLLVLVFIRAGLRGAMTDAESRQKLDRIKNAFLLRRQPR